MLHPVEFRWLCGAAASFVNTAIFFSLLLFSFGADHGAARQDSWSHETSKVGQEEFTHDRVMWQRSLSSRYFPYSLGQKKGWPGNPTLFLCFCVVIEKKEWREGVHYCAIYFVVRTTLVLSVSNREVVFSYSLIISILLMKWSSLYSLPSAFLNKRVHQVLLVEVVA